MPRLSDLPLELLRTILFELSARDINNLFTVPDWKEALEPYVFVYTGLADEYRYGRSMSDRITHRLKRPEQLEENSFTSQAMFLILEIKLSGSSLDEAYELNTPSGIPLHIDISTTSSYRNTLCEDDFITVANSGSTLCSIADSLVVKFPQCASISFPGINHIKYGSFLNKLPPNVIFPNVISIEGTSQEREDEAPLIPQRSHIHKMMPQLHTVDINKVSLKAVTIDAVNATMVHFPLQSLMFDQNTTELPILRSLNLKKLSLYKFTEVRYVALCDISILCENLVRHGSFGFSGLAHLKVKTNLGTFSLHDIQAPSSQTVSFGCGIVLQCTDVHVGEVPGHLYLEKLDMDPHPEQSMKYMASSLVSLCCFQEIAGETRFRPLDLLSCFTSVTELSMGSYRGNALYFGTFNDVYLQLPALEYVELRSALLQVNQHWPFKECRKVKELKLFLNPDYLDSYLPDIHNFHPQLTKLTVSNGVKGCKDTKESHLRFPRRGSTFPHLKTLCIEKFGNLTMQYCSFPKLETLDASGVQPWGYREETNHDLTVRANPHHIKSKVDFTAPELFSLNFSGYNVDCLDITSCNKLKVLYVGSSRHVKVADHRTFMLWHNSSFHRASGTKVTVPSFEDYSANLPTDFTSFSGY